MKVNELMIGDWVLVAETNQPRKIEGTNDLLFHDDYVPIPLTESILVKNGFEKNGNCHSIVIERQMAGDGIECQFVGIYNCSSITIEYASGKLHISIKYVHELQHLLRLCGIEKEIEL